MILIIDNYDSFTFNLVQYVGSMCTNIRIIKNNECSIDNIKEKDYSHIIISPGPGRPEKIGISNEIIKTISQNIPTLGICLGHQAIAYNFGAKITNSKFIVHGKTSHITHNNNSTIFNGVPTTFYATRYHSLSVDKLWRQKEIIITSYSDDGEIMSIEHKKYPMYGIQFHPESIMTKYGMQIIKNFIT